MSLAEECRKAELENCYAVGLFDRLADRIEALEAALTVFMGGDEKMQISIGGNPIYVDRFLARVNALLAHRDGKW